jgi:hypothetical protein
VVRPDGEDRRSIPVFELNADAEARSFDSTKDLTFLVLLRFVSYYSCEKIATIGTDALGQRTEVIPVDDAHNAFLTGKERYAKSYHKYLKPR